MKHLIFWIVLSCLFGGNAVCQEEKKIAIPQLLDLNMRTQALQKFVLSADPETEIYGWKDHAKFSKDHQDIGVLVSLNRREGKQRYVVTWKHDRESEIDLSLPGEAYSKADFDRLFPPIEPSGLMVQQRLEMFVFEEDGSPVKLGGSLSSPFHGFVMDLNGDGAIEVLEEEESNSIKYVTVRDLTGQQTLFAVAYEWGDLQDREQPWGYAVRDARGNGIYDILFGPERNGTITPEAVFRWDARLTTWVCKSPGKHLKTLDSKHLSKGLTMLAANKSAKATASGNQGSGNSIASTPSLAEARENSKQSAAYLNEHSYHFKSLAKLGNAALLEWMGGGYQAWDARSDHPYQALPPGFWTADAKVATLAFVLRNRPKDVPENYRLAIDNLDEREAPKEGTLAVSAPGLTHGLHGIAQEYFLKCSREASYMTVVRRSGPWSPKHELNPEFACDIRTIPLTYEEACRVLQTVWWLDRVRSKRVREAQGTLAKGSEDTPADFQLESSQGRIEFQGMRDDRNPSQGVAGSILDASYDKSACLNLVTLFVCDALPMYLGERWKRFDFRAHQPFEEAPSLKRDYSQKKIDALKSAVPEQLRLFLAGGLGESAATEVVVIAKELELTDLTPDLQKMADFLPPPTSQEKRLQELETEITKWRKRLGPDDTSDSDSDRRRNPSSYTGIPNASGAPTAANPGSQVEESIKTAPPAPDPKFASLDALYEEREKLLQKQSISEEKTAKLRDHLKETIRWFGIKDDPQKLFEFATESVDQVMDGCRRLRKLDPVKAIAALKFWEAREKESERAKPLLQAIDDIQDGAEKDQVELSTGDADTRAILRLGRLPRAANSDAQAAAIMAIVLDKHRYDSQEAMELLAPPDNPRKFPGTAVDEFLLRILDREDQESMSLWPAASLALAKRDGGQRWDLIVSKSGANSTNLTPESVSQFASFLPALVAVVLKEGEPFRSRLRDLIAPRLVNTSPGLDDLLRAAWTADLRELKPQIERLATSRPNEVEGVWTLSKRHGMTESVRRSHLARQIASLWNERDPETRVKLLVAFGLQQPYVFGKYFEAERLRSALAGETARLTPEQTKGVAGFIEWWAHSPERAFSSLDVEAGEWVSLAKACLMKE